MPSYADNSKSSISKYSKENYIVLNIEYGTLVIQLYPDIAPEHVKRIQQLCNEKFYDGLKFHRAIPGFMVQTGDPLGNGTGSSNLPNLKAEFNSLNHDKGIVSMARNSNVNSGNSQFFIMLDKHSYLDHNYTAFGKVIFGINSDGKKTDGMDILNKIHMGRDDNNGEVSDPTTINKMYLMSSSYDSEMEKIIWDNIEHNSIY
ncbi:peptidylprolyl isomerase [Lyticum sinuosum]|nr:peptidylprolyl isomerase [Lyticum sinuosum]